MKTFKLIDVRIIIKQPDGVEQGTRHRIHAKPGHELSTKHLIQVLRQESDMLAREFGCYHFRMVRLAANRVNLIGTLKGHEPVRLLREPDHS